MKVLWILGVIATVAFAYLAVNNIENQTMFAGFVVSVVVSVWCAARGFK